MPKPVMQFISQRRRLRHCLLGIGLGLGALTAQATHLVGGDFSYVHLGGDQYEITLTVYRDCSPANTNDTYFDLQVAIGMWNGSGTIGPNDVLSIALQNANVSEVPVIMGNPCGTPPPELCIQRAIYTSVVTLPANEYGWDLVYQRCCRNPTISNLDDLGGTENAGMTLMVHIPGTGVISESNSSPAFQELPPVALCANLPFVWNHSAVDPDGDDLVYSLCPPLQGGDAGNAQPNPPSTPPYNPVPYLPGFSWDNPMTALPGMAIDASTGQLTVTPTQVGQYAVGICVSEYRNGQLLSTVIRDFQFNVTVCEPAIIDLDTEAIPFAAGGLTSLVPYEDAIGLPAVISYPNGESFPMASWLANNNMTVQVDGESFIADAVVIEGCNDARFTIHRPESESEFLDTLFLELEGTAFQGLDFAEDFYEVIMPAGESSSDIELGLMDDDVNEGVEHLVITCTYVNGCGQTSTNVAHVVILDPIPVSFTPAPLSCLDALGSQVIGYETIEGYGPFHYTWEGRSWDNATEPTLAWTVSFDSTFSMLDPEGHLVPDHLLTLVAEDQCGDVHTHQLEVLHPVMFETELCGGEVIEFPAHNDGIPIVDVNVNGVSIIHANIPNIPLTASAVPEGDLWILYELRASEVDMTWNGMVSLIDSCGYVTEANLRVRDCIVPNVITPDNSGGNNTLRVRGLLGLAGSTLTIYNRWGSVVWQDQTNIDDQDELVWDGNALHGNPAPDGHYQWLLVRSDGVREQGEVTVFRRQ
ncbi:MAG: gliding motility-associated C-terminal domain-containing protein [Bacteroidetes bacterium]|nr:gliding motility-associated C-terminal domain-containing protein [Bacteroidota bacterium]